MSQNNNLEHFVTHNIPDGATVEPLLRGSSENYGGTPGYFVYTTCEGISTEPTGHSLIRYETTADGVKRTEVVDDASVEALAAIELRPGTRGATLVTVEGESTYLTATAALGSFMTRHFEDTTTTD